MRILLFICLSFVCHAVAMAQANDETGFFMWDEATTDAVIEDAYANGHHSFRSRDLTILYQQSAWDVFKKYPSTLDVMVAIPVYYTYTTTPVDMLALADTINSNPFIRRLQIYPKLQPGLVNPSELNPCNDWLTGYANAFEQRIRQIDQLVTDKSVEIVIAGQLGTPGCSDLTQIVTTLYDLQSTGRKVAWAVTVYPYYYGTQDASLATLTSDVNEVLVNLTQLAPAGKTRLPLRVIETGWPSECSSKATPANHCTFASSAFDYQATDVKLYYFELQDFADGWSACEKHFGLYDVSGQIKCENLVTDVTAEKEMDGVEVYPVPSSHQLTVETQGSNIRRIDLYNAQGALVSYRDAMKEEKITIDLSTLQKGIYTLIIQKEGQSETRKIVIE
jgi:Secretion system C-terminal sorting domain